MDPSTFSSKYHEAVAKMKRQYTQRRAIEFTELSSECCYRLCVADPLSVDPADSKNCIEQCHKKFLASRQLVQQQMTETLKINQASMK